MGLSNEQLEKAAVFIGLSLILLVLIYNILILIGLAPGIPFCGVVPCITVILGIGMVLATYAVYKYGGKRDQKTNERLERSYKRSLGFLKFAVILSLVSVLAMMLIIGGVAAVWIYFQYQHPLQDSHGAGLASPTSAPTASPASSWKDNTPQQYKGPIVIDQEKLVQTDLIVAIWQSKDASLQSADGSYLSVPKDFNNYILIIYNDHTYLLFDRPNNTYVKGTWEKTVDNPYYNEYTVHEGDSTFPATKITYSQLSIQYIYTYKDDPPHSILSYIDYRLLAHYPVKPDIQDYINKRD